MKIFEILEQIETENEPEEISILLTNEALSRCRLSIVQESIWMDSGYKSWMYRVDPEDPDIPQKRHIHIAKNKHTRSKNMQASWNSDGTRHDKKSFNPSIGNVDRVREIARNVLKINPGIVLEDYKNYPSGKLLVEEVSSAPDGMVAYVFLHVA